MNGGGARCGVAGGEGVRRFVRRALRIDSQLGGGEGKRCGKPGKRRRGRPVGSRRRRREVEDDADEWDRGVGDWERGRGRGGAGRL
jgi:hypothetical protein